MSFDAISASLIVWSDICAGRGTQMSETAGKVPHPVWRNKAAQAITSVTVNVANGHSCSSEKSPGHITSTVFSQHWAITSKCAVTETAFEYLTDECVIKCQHFKRFHAAMILHPWLWAYIYETEHTYQCVIGIFDAFDVSYVGYPRVAHSLKSTRQVNDGWITQLWAAASWINWACCTTYRR